MPAASLTSAARVDAAIDAWQRQLLNLSRGNSLLYFAPGEPVAPAASGGVGAAESVGSGAAPVAGRRASPAFGRSLRGIPIARPDPATLFDRLANQDRKQTIVRAPASDPLSLDLGPAAPADAESLGAESSGPGGAVDDADARRAADTGATLLERSGPGRSAQPRLKANEILLEADPDRLDALLYRLRLRARSALLEQGIDVLYVAFGLLEWRAGAAGAGASGGDPRRGQGDGERIRSPLLLVPVRLERPRAVDPYVLVPLDEPPILNPALAYQVEAAFQVVLELPEPEPDGDYNYAAALDAIRRQVAVRPDWAVHDGAHLGLFSFAKQAMYADLAANRERLAKHPLVRALAGLRGSLQDLALPDPTHLDELEDPRDTFQVLDADASQRTVLAAIRHGGNLVVQGPPGTGKSQTIANAIAEMLARGKTVLFVSEKLAALQVVARRLEAAGLGAFCLEAHGHGGDKAAIVTALADALPAAPVQAPHPPTDTLTILHEQRAALNAYARALHDAATPLGMSAYTVHGELAKRIAAPRVLFDVPSIGSLTVDRAIRLVGLVRRLVPLAGVVTAPEQHPWHGFTGRRWTPLLQAQLETTLDRLAGAAEALAEAAGAVGSRWGLSPEPSLAGSRWLVRVLGVLETRPPSLARWLARPATADLAEQVRSWDGRCQAYEQHRLRLLSHYREDVFQLDLPAVVAAFERVEVAAIERLRGDGPAADRALALRPRIEQAGRRALRAIPALQAAAADVADRLGVPHPRTAADAADLLWAADLIRADPRPERGWLQPGRAGRLIDLANEAARQCARAASNRAALAEQFDGKLLAAITPALAERFEVTYPSWTRGLRPSWYGDIGLLRRHLRADRASGGLSYGEAAAAVRRWQELTAAERWLAEQAPALATTFGRSYLGDQTDWDAVKASLAIVWQLADLLGDLTRWPRVGQLLLAPEGPPSLDLPAERLRAALAEYEAAEADLTTVIQIDRSPVGQHGLAAGLHTGASTGGQRDQAAGRSGGQSSGAAADAGLAARSDALRSDIAARPDAPPAGAEPRPDGPRSSGPDRSGSLAALAADLEHWLAALAPLWWAADALLGCRRHRTVSVAELRAEARDALACPAFEREFAAAMPMLALELGPFFKGLATEWRRVGEALAWTERLRACFDRPPPRSFLLALDAEARGPIAEGPPLNRAVGRLHELREALAGSFGEGGPLIGSLPFDRAPLSGIAAWARARHAALPRLQEWIDARALLGELDGAGLGGFVTGLIREAPPVDLWEDAFLRQLFTLWLTWRYDHAPALDRFRRPDHEALIAEFADGDRRQWELAARRIAATLLPRRPPKSGAVADSEVGLLVKESLKKRRYKPLRRLFRELPNLLAALKPCLLMSPLSVAQHLGDSAVTFDLVVFDEASQVLPADAIGAIGRGRQVVVVGDRRQLPPTRFFQVTSLDTADDEQADEEPPESILDACLQAGVPECALLWHYRSRHERLIAFSNGQFYDNRLQTFPSPDADERVVTLHHVPDGVYDAGRSRTNPVEATVVADLIVEHVRAQAALPAAHRQSLGAIAFSEAQMLAILAELERRRRADPDLEPLLAEDADDGVFVKNLEAVQGDERDVILLSVGYGPDRDGKLALRFGPLNATGGERRLNVAVTRARRRTVVVSSIRAHDIDAGPERPAGVRALRQYLAYAEHGPAAIVGRRDGAAGAAAGDGSPGGPFEAAIHAALAAHLRVADRADLEVVRGVGVGGQPVDLAVRDGTGRYLLGIECDGAVFASLPTARDRDRLRRQVLEQLGWQLHRVWSADWIVAPRQELERAVAAIERARLIRDGVAPHDAPLALMPQDRPPTQGGARPNASIPTGGRRQAGEPPPDRAAGAPPAPSPTVAPAGLASVSPAPATATPTTPLGSASLRDADLEAIDREVPSPGAGPAARRRPGADRAMPRPIDRVPRPAVDAAVLAVLRRAFAMPRDPLLAATARELGYLRTGSQIRAVIGRAIDALQERGVVAEVGGNLRLADA